jgi:hypothetical protein
MMGLWLSDTESDQRADGKPESDSESVCKYLTRVTVSEASDTGAKGKGLGHGECSLSECVGATVKISGNDAVTVNPEVSDSRQDVMPYKVSQGFVMLHRQRWCEGCCPLTIDVNGMVNPNERELGSHAIGASD